MACYCLYPYSAAVIQQNYSKQIAAATSSSQLQEIISPSINKWSSIWIACKMSGMALTFRLPEVGTNIILPFAMLTVPTGTYYGMTNRSRNTRTSYITDM